MSRSPCTNPKVVDGRCVCPSCERRRRLDRLAKVRVRLGTQDSLVNAKDTIRKVAALRKAGLTIPYIAKKVGYSPQRLKALMGSKRPTGHNRKADDRMISGKRALAVEKLYDEIMFQRLRGLPVANEEVGSLYAGMVPARLTRLAIQGMMAQGWSMGWIAKSLGMSSRRRIHQLLHEVKVVTPETEKSVVALAKKIGSAESTDPRASRVKNEAAKKGYLPTMYTDELV